MLSHATSRGLRHLRRLPKIEDTEKRFPSPDEITQLADTIDPRYRALVITRPDPTA
ncbi:MAG: hypothetical protein MUQ27_14815 [Acidimicrobiia bacterium]|nr:hypothetical protein [Acidimicrobiia bacterium]